MIGVRSLTSCTYDKERVNKLKCDSTFSEQASMKWEEKNELN